MKNKKSFLVVAAFSLLTLAPPLVGCGKGGKGGGGLPNGEDSGSGGSAGSSEHVGSGGTSSSGGSAGRSGQDEDPELNTDSYDKSVFGIAEPDPDDPSHPLVGRETKLLRRDEVSVLLTGSTNSGFTLDDGTQNYELLSASAAPALSGLVPFGFARANVDDDGQDELIVVGTASGNLVVRVIDSDADGMFSDHQDFTVAGTNYLHARVNAADMDGDGRAEILVTAVTASGAVVRLYDDAEGDFELIDEVYAGPAQEIAAALGNFDDDRDTELALLIDAGDTLRLEIRDGLADDFALLQTLDAEALGLREGDQVRGLRLEAGNFVAGGRDELVAFSDSWNNDGAAGIESVCFENTADDGEPVQFTFVSDSYRSFEDPHPETYRNDTEWPWQTLALDSNGDGTDEAFVLVRWSTGIHFRWSLTVTAYDDTSLWSGTTRSIVVADEINGTVPAFMTRAGGHPDSLGSNIIVTHLEEDTLTTQRVTPATREETIGERAETVFYPAIHPIDSRTVAENSRVWVTGGDFEGDSLTIRYTGQKWLELARPRPMVLLSAAPAKEGISQNYVECVTGYGTSSSSEQSNTQEYGVTHKVSLSFEGSFPGVSFLTAGAQASLSANFTQTHTQTSSTTYASSYGGAYPDDVIIFNGALFTRYEYEIMAGDPDLIGTLMTIDVPRAARVYKWTADYYNDSLPASASPLEGSLRSHVPGDPSSYPTPSQRSNLGPLWQTPVSQVMTVGQGRSSSTVEIEVGSQMTSGSSRTISTEFGGSLGAFVTAGYSQAWDDTEAYSVTVGEATTYSGTVGDIETRSDYTDWHYSFGLFVYPATLAGGEKLHVVQYWTEDLAPGYSE